MQYFKARRVTVTMLIATIGASGAADLSSWFSNATAANHSGTAVAASAPDFLPGKSMQSMHCGGGGVPIGAGIWQLVKYDRTHKIALAVASTDQCSVALFEAAPPAVNVPNADLSQISTGRGIRIGSPYAQLVTTYGGKPKADAGRSIVMYSANVPGTSVAHPTKKIVNPETMTFVVERGRVTAMTVSIDLGGEF